MVDAAERLLHAGEAGLEGVCLGGSQEEDVAGNDVLFVDERIHRHFRPEFLLLLVF